MLARDLLACELAERAQAARQAARRADAALADWLAQPAYLRRDPAQTVALASVAAAAAHAAQTVARWHSREVGQA